MQNLSAYELHNYDARLRIVFHFLFPQIMGYHQHKFKTIWLTLIFHNWNLAENLTKNERNQKLFLFFTVFTASLCSHAKKY